MAKINEEVQKIWKNDDSKAIFKDVNDNKVCLTNETISDIF